MLNHISAILIGVFCAVFVAANVTARANAETMFINVSILPMDGRGLVEGQTVIVDADRITAIGDAGELPVSDTATVIDGTGKFLMPGFGEMHGHIPPLSQGDQAVNDTLFLYLSNGVTTVRGMLGSDGQLTLRADAASGARLSPTLYLAGPSFNGNSVNSPDEARKKVEQQVKEGWDLLKVHPGLTRAEYDAMAQAAKRLGVSFGGHVPEKVGLLHALDTRQRTLDHLDGYMAHLNGAGVVIEEEALRDIARKTRAAGVGVVPTSALWATLIGAGDLEALKKLEELQYVSPQLVKAWSSRVGFLRTGNPSIHKENRRRLLKILQEEGVEILFGTDAPQLFSVPGFSIHREIEEMTAAGLAAAEILASGTSTIGAYYSDKDKFGTIAPGMRADLILLDGNPLADLAALKRPRGVMVRGRFLSREDIDRELAAIASRAGAQ